MSMNYRPLLPQIQGLGLQQQRELLLLQPQLLRQLDRLVLEQSARH